MERIHFMKTIWSDSTLIESENKYALIDTADTNETSILTTYFDKLGITTFEFLFITHFHKDHFSGAIELLNKYQFKNVYIQEYSGVDSDDGSGNKATDEYHNKTMAIYNEICRLAKEKSKLYVLNESIKYVTVGKFNFKIFRGHNYITPIYNDPSSPFYHQYKFSENYNSTALFARVNNANVYLASDLTDCNNVIDEFCYINTRIAREINAQVDIYKVAHHGTCGCNTNETLAILKPKNAIFTNNYYYLERWGVLYDINNSNKDSIMLTTEKKYIVYTIHDDGSVTHELYSN